MSRKGPKNLVGWKNSSISTIFSFLTQYRAIMSKLLNFFNSVSCYHVRVFVVSVKKKHRGWWYLKKSTYTCDISKRSELGYDLFRVEMLKRFNTTFFAEYHPFRPASKIVIKARWIQKVSPDLNKDIKKLESK